MREPEAAWRADDVVTSFRLDRPGATGTREGEGRSSRSRSARIDAPRV